MDTTKTHGADTREVSGKMSVWLVCMALVTVASGCGGCQQMIREPFPMDPTGSISTCPGGPTCGISKALMEEVEEPDCPTGNCDPGGSGNARGIYTIEGGNYCFVAKGQQHFCPEAFINTPEGVMLDVRYLTQSGVIRTQVRGRLEANTQRVDVLAITSDRTELAIKYRVQGEQEVKVAKGDDLSKLILRLDTMPMRSGDTGVPILYELRFTAYKPPGREATTDKVHRYELEYRDVRADTEWAQHCEKDGLGAVVSFLQGERVSGVNASVKLDPNVTTMGCEKGSIVTCLAWGYTPWEPSTGVRDETRDYVFRSCLQAKRAAYFVGKGNTKSYTQSGTEIFKWDQYAYGDGNAVERVEALWSPQGAVCINKENVRKLEAWGQPQDPKMLNTYGVGPCTSKDFTVEGKLFTGIRPEALAKP
ncbi:ADYC domain-containing protein [Archangium lansingense]|uniref:ADYC domain-containing protein n=1 Tax=Archangium lansingense TaxID=2995310 RepID=UPI003B7E7719